MSKVLLVDGSAVAYRAHFALSKANLVTSDGKVTSATYGYTNTLLKLLREIEPDYACVAFDTEAPTERHLVYAEYKAGRPGMPSDLVDQLEWIRQITTALGIRLVEKEGYEADDIIATLAVKLASDGKDVVIATGDKDMLQIVGERIRVVMLSGWGRETVTMGEREVVTKYGICPELLPDYFGLMGDSIDNIPGVPGIGKKIARDLVSRFGSLENIYDQICDVGPARVKKLLLEGKHLALQSRDLVRVRTDVPLEIGAEDIKYQGPDTERLTEIFRRLGFRRLLLQVGKSQDRLTTRYEIWKDTERSELEIPTGRWVGVEVNWSGERQAAIYGYAVSFADTDIYFPIGHKEPGSVEISKTPLPLILESGDIPKIAHDAKKVMLAAHRVGVDVKRIEFDTMLAAYLLRPGERIRDIDDVAIEHLGITPASHVTNEIPTITQAAQILCSRTRMLLKLREVLESELQESGLLKLFKEIEMPLVEVLADMETRGVRVDVDLLNEFNVELDGRLFHIEREAYSLAGRKFNLNSPKEVGQILFTELGLKPRRKTKTGYATDFSVLVELAAEHELPRKIIEYRQLAKLKSTYVEQLLRSVDPNTGRIHAHFNQAVTATGRLSSSEPNLQNIPVGDQMGIEIRRAFIPTDGWVFVSGDYSQIELRVLAHYCRDEALVEAFRKDEDIHTMTAAAIFHVKPQDVSPRMRAVAKIVNFGIIYGMGVGSLAKTAGLTEQEASKFIEEHKSKYPGVYHYIETTLENARQRGYVETLLGRRRYLSGLASAKGGVRSAAERMAINAPIQGSAADIIKIAMLRVYERLSKGNFKAGIVIQVHDEILVECPHSELEEVKQILKEEMGNAYELFVPLKVEIATGRNWHEAHR